MKEKWSDLPHDLLSQIANGLGLIDFLRFRGVCKDWRVASSKLSVEDKSDVLYTWFLINNGEEGAVCSPHNRRQGKLCYFYVPELDGSTCLASCQGWLLIFRNGSLFFSCPLSGAKVELPNIPFTQVTDHVATFVSAPTSQDCFVAVVKRNSDCDLDLFMLHRGQNQWSKYSFLGPKFNTIKSPYLYEEGEFHFLDEGGDSVTLNICETERYNYSIGLSSSAKSASDGDELSCAVYRNAFVLEYKKRKKGLLEENDSISTSGTINPHISFKYDIVTEKPECHIKALWFRPSYYYVPPDQSW